jgi:hypothetical protein
MANPTTNYGWPMPTSSDLVTDLPADFDAFGQPVDNTLKALNPETTLGDISYRSAVSNTNTRLGIGSEGQVLSVSSGVPAWTTTADVTPLTTKGDVFTFSTEDARIGVGADGTVLTANSSQATGLEWASPSDQTPLTTKGDVFTFSTEDARIGVGANGTVLTADSGEATGLVWAAPGPSTAAGCSLKNSANQTISNATYTAFPFDGEDFDTDGYHDNATNNSRITIPAGKGGKYIVSGRVTWQSNATDQRRIQIRLNGSATAVDLFTTGTSVAGEPFTMQTTRYLSLVATDYIEMFIYQASGGNLTAYGDAGLGVAGTFFGAMLIGA